MKRNGILAGRRADGRSHEPTTARLTRPLRLGHVARVLAVCALCPAAVVAPVRAQAQPAFDVKQLTLEELMDIDVYSASRRLEPVQTTPSATYVLSAEDIRRARVTSVPEALRLVPGVHVGRVDANKWAVAIRGFDSRESNKILVLVDGRSIYDPLFGGTFWEAQDVLLEDVERIEVVRGPGGTLWGANAFNGVINIITKNARDTQGGLVTAGAGNEERYFAAARYGWRSGDNQYARVYAKSFERDDGFLDPVSANDSSRATRGGFRWDWNGARDQMRVSGEIANTAADERAPAITQQAEHRHSNLIAHWTRRISASDRMDLQLNYTHVGFRSETFNYRQNAYDLHFQQSAQATPRHLFVWGAGYRNARDHAQTAPVFRGFLDVLPAERHDELSNIFLQDTVTLVPERWHLVLGTKLENTDYAEHEWQPNARLSWTPNLDETWWASVSRAVRMPSRLDADLTFNPVLPGVSRPGDTFRPEHVTAYEVGHRRLVTPQFWYDAAAFYNRYSDLALVEPIDFSIRNKVRGHAYGFELATRWAPRRSWRLEGAYTYFKMNLGVDADSTADPDNAGRFEGLTPRHQLTLRSAHDLAPDLEFDAAVRFVDKVRSFDIPAYTELDLSITWYPRTGLELSLVGKNLLDSHHPEQDFLFGNNGVGTEAERSVYVKATQRF